MKSTTKVIIIVLILIAGGLYVNLNNTNISGDALVKNKTTEGSMIVKKEDTISTTSDTIMQKELMVKGVTYEVYSPEKVMNASSGNVILFFKASWCPSCRAVDSDIKKKMANMSTDLKILEVDYDKYTDLKKKYSVTTQHTFVQIDKDENMIKKWSGGNTLNSIIAEVK